jgi:hypothetical protein
LARFLSLSNCTTAANQGNCLQQETLGHKASPAVSME